jgi:hypothetical protein
MNYNEIFQQYYNLYRAEATTPDSTDDEYVIGMRFANDAIRRWASYDNTMWKELFGKSTDDGNGQTTTAGTTDYDGPDDLRDLGGYIILRNTDGTINKRIPVLDPQQGQFRGESSNYAYFTGDPGNGYTIHFNSAPTESGLTIDFDYYKKPTLITSGSSKPQMSNPDFIVDHMLANRYRASRNPYYGTAKRDAENKLAQMKMENDSGSWSNPWVIPDNSGTVWGGGDFNNPWSW